MEPTAIFLLAYGGPLSLDDVEPYLLDVRHGRPTPRELVEEVRERYRLIGGKSPLLEHTQAQARALEAWLHRHVGPHFKTFVGMRHWHPYIHEVLPDILNQGFRRIVALPMAPHYSRMSIGAYRHALEKALEAQGYRPAEDGEQSAGSSQPSGLRYEVKVWDQEAATGEGASVTDRPLPTADRRPPTADRRLPTADRRPLTAEFRRGL